MEGIKGMRHRVFSVLQWFLSSSLYESLRSGQRLHGLYYILWPVLPQPGGKGGQTHDSYSLLFTSHNLHRPKEPRGMLCLKENCIMVAELQCLFMVPDQLSKQQWLRQALLLYCAASWIWPQCTTQLVKVSGPYKPIPNIRSFLWSSSRSFSVSVYACCCALHKLFAVEDGVGFALQLI